MIPSTLIPADTGLEVIDIQDDSVFVARHVRLRDDALLIEGLQRVAYAFVKKPETILQELVNVAVEICGADSAGICTEKSDSTDEDFYHWAAVAGQYSSFLHVTLPRYPSACSICLDRGRPQTFRVGQEFFDLLEIQAPLVTDGILLPWKVEEMRGTIFIMAHGRTEAFDRNDCSVMKMLADFATMGVRQQRQQQMLLEHVSNAAAAAMANELAHKINNPLQNLTKTLYSAAADRNGMDAMALGQQAFDDLEELSMVVRKLLAFPGPKTQ